MLTTRLGNRFNALQEELRRLKRYEPASSKYDNLSKNNSNYIHTQILITEWKDSGSNHREIYSEHKGADLFKQSKCWR